MKLTVVPVVVLVALLVGCTSAPAAGPSASPTATPSASATEIPSATPSPEPEVFTVDGTGWSIRGLDLESTGTWGDASGHPHTDDLELPAKLTALLGAEPAISTTPANGHYPDYTVYTWPGVALAMPAYQSDDWHWNPQVTFTAGSSGSVELRTTGGISVGAAEPEVAAAAFQGFPVPDGTTNYSIEADHEVPADYDPGNPGDAWNTVNVVVSAEGAVIRIVAPYPFGAVL